jgi:L-2-hydroxyglutarate oxidase LhgO
MAADMGRADMTERVECVVIGAGVVGLAVARNLAMAGREVVVVERADAIGTETSARNSEVIHAGIYYPKGSLKARYCVAGKHALYEYCAAAGVAHRRCGKLIVATSDAEIAELERLQGVAAGNDVPDLEWKTASEVRELEPAISCVAALLSPSTGIIDTHGLMLAYQGDAEAHGAAIALLSPVIGGRVGDDGITLRVGGAEPMEISASIVINSAGLWANKIAHAIEGLNPDTIPRYYFAKGNYFTLSGRAPFSRPIYPVPGPAGLGVHVTIDMGGQVKFGPDVQWLDTNDPDLLDYQVDPARGEGFYEAVRRYYPALADGAIQTGYCGIRPKLQAPGGAARDFVIQGPDEHGVTGLINLYGIESPGLTSSLAIADAVAKKLQITS